MFTNIGKHPFLICFLVFAVVGLILARVGSGSGAYGVGFAFSAVTIFSVTMLGVLGMYPALLPSTLDPAFSLTVANAASSQMTLCIMLSVVAVFVPIIILYQTWVYATFSHKVTEEELAYSEAY